MVYNFNNISVIESSAVPFVFLVVFYAILKILAGSVKTKKGDRRNIPLNNTGNAKSQEMVKKFNEKLSKSSQGRFLSQNTGTSRVNPHRHVSLDFVNSENYSSNIDRSRDLSRRTRVDEVLDTNGLWLQQKQGMDRINFEFNKAIEAQHKKNKEIMNSCKFNGNMGDKITRVKNSR